MSKQLNIRVPDQEMEILEQYAKATHRAKTDIIREFIRSLDSAALQRRERGCASQD
jgi:predicted DNA-binding protein